MFLRLQKRRRAIKRFVWLLPLELKNRFGEKHCYSIEEVNRALCDERFDSAFSSFAHALFCTKEAFDAHYEPLKVKCSYYGLRRVVAKRFFKGIIDFDAAALFRFAKGLGGGYYYESGIADSADTHSTSSHH